MSSKAIFLDKDGTLIEDIPYNVVPSLIRLSGGALEALRSFQEEGYQLIVVSNQSGVARGFFSEQELQPVKERLQELLLSAGVKLTGFYYCPHHPAGTVREYAIKCTCRKPQPGMLYVAALEHHLDLSASWMVGDMLDDMEAGNQAGCRTVLIDNKHETEWAMTVVRRPEFIVQDLKEAASVITSEGRVDRNLRNGKQEQRFNQNY